MSIKATDPMQIPPVIQATVVSLSLFLFLFGLVIFSSLGASIEIVDADIESVDVGIETVGALVRGRAAFTST